MAKRNPTKETYGEFQQAYDFFNRRLFENRLPSCLITLQRKNRAYGYFSGDRWKSGRAKTDEIAINPDFFAEGIEETLSTLVHEMVHLWQHHFGKPGRRGYHNREWAGTMLDIGLHPSDTGKKGGKMTGEHMSEYRVKNGKFDVVTKELLGKGFKVSWQDRAAVLTKQLGGTPAPVPVRNTRQKYSCKKCGLNAWAKPAAKLVCGTCKMKMRPA